MPLLTTKQALGLVVWGSLILGLGGCSTLGGGHEETNWDFSRPYPNLPPARSPHSTGQVSGSFATIEGIYPTKLRELFSKSPEGRRSSGGRYKQGMISPPSAQAWPVSAHGINHDGGSRLPLYYQTPLPSVLFWQAEEALLNGHNQLAYQYLEQAVLSNPNDPFLWQKAALVALRANEPEMASELARQALERFPECALLWQVAALARYRMGDFAAAEQAARRAISLDNRYPLSYFLVGAALHQQGQIPQAVGYLEHAARLDPRFAPTGPLP
ncbi:MAG: tetratricopeptide repeat protein [Thermoguttaceae bacterium]|nr:tetratricopeptide repeat protein [Thermoguttaceae bacterium]MDW8038341.1 tetratricopeptide repeat protein [Thermoguttaceae bacterium]